MMSNDSLLSLLEAEAGEYVSGEEISRKLNVSRTAIWKQVRKLEAKGTISRPYPVSVIA